MTADLERVRQDAKAAIPKHWLQLPQEGTLTAEQRDNLAQQTADEEPLAPFLPPPELDLDYRPEGSGRELVLQVKSAIQAFALHLPAGPCCREACIRTHYTSAVTKPSMALQSSRRIWSSVIFEASWSDAGHVPVSMRSENIRCGTDNINAPVSPDDHVRSLQDLSLALTLNDMHSCLEIQSACYTIS